MGFRVWHHANAVLMAVLLLTGLSLHFPNTPVALIDFGWSHRLHEWSGFALCAAYAGFLGLCLVFGRRLRADAEGMTMMASLPLIVLSGLAFLWPSVLPDRVWGYQRLGAGGRRAQPADGLDPDVPDPSPESRPLDMVAKTQVAGCQLVTAEL